MKNGWLKQMLIFILIAYIYSWLIEFVAIYQMNFHLQFDKLYKYLFVAQFGPTIAAISTILIFNGYSGLKKTARRIFIFRFSITNYLLILFCIPLVLMMTLKVFNITPTENSNCLLIYITLLASPINGLLGGFLNGIGPLGEEYGWRGFLLPHLLSKYNDLISSIILGIVWAFWHFPIFFFDEFRIGLTIMEFIFLYPVSTILISYFMTKVWHLSRGSVFIAIWVHGIINSSLGYVSNNKIWMLSYLTSRTFYLIVIFALLLSCFVVRIRLIRLKNLNSSKWS